MFAFPEGSAALSGLESLSAAFFRWKEKANIEHSTLNAERRTKEAKETGGRSLFR
jgi:hypothetical protein